MCIRDRCRPLVAIPQVINGKPLYEMAYEANSANDDFVDLLGREFSESIGRVGVYREHNNVYYDDMNHSINDSSNGVTQGSPHEIVAHKLKGMPADWMILLRVYSDNKSGFSFNDAGELYFMIHKSDLAKKDFSNVFAYVDSS